MFTNKYSMWQKFVVLMVVALTAIILWAASASQAQGPEWVLTDREWRGSSVYGDAGDRHWGNVKLAEVSGVTKGVFCMDIYTVTYNGTRYRQGNVVDNPRLHWLIVNYPPSLDLSYTEAAARQAAVWYFSDGWSISYSTRAGVRDRAWQIINHVNSIPDPAASLPKPPEISISPSYSKGKAGDAIEYSVFVTQNGSPLANQTVNLSTDFGALSTESVTTDASGRAVFSITSGKSGKANISASFGYELPKAIRLEPTITPRQILTGLIMEPGIAEATAEAEWTELIMIKEAENLPVGNVFPFEGPGEVNFSLRDGQSTRIDTPGWYTEVLPDGEVCAADPYILYDVICVDDEGNEQPISKDLAAFSAYIPDTDENMTCTFKNYEAWNGTFGEDYSICQYEPGWITSTVTINIPDYMQPPFYIQTDWYIVHPNDPICPPGVEDCSGSHTTSQLITQTGTFEVDVVAWWPGVQPGNEVVEIHYGANVLDGNRNPYGCGIGQDIYWYPHICLPPQASNLTLINEMAPFTNTAILTDTIIVTDTEGITSVAEISETVVLSSTLEFAVEPMTATTTITDGAAVDFLNLKPETYTVRVDPSSFPDGTWQVEAVTCVDQDNNPFTPTLVANQTQIPVAVDQHVTCTVQSGPQDVPDDSSSLTIVQAVDKAVFGRQVGYENEQLGEFTLQAGQSRQFIITPTVYTITQNSASFAESAFVSLIDVDCVDQTGSDIPITELNFDDRYAVIPVETGQHLQCTFLNEAAGVDASQAEPTKVLLPIILR